MNTPLLDSARRGFSLTTKMIIVGVLVFLCWLASLLVWGVISERQNRQAEAEAQIAEQWGRPQLVAGPIIAVPYYETVISGGVQSVVRHNLYVLPAELNIDTKLEPELRSRGIFNAPVYRASLAFTGKFAPPNYTLLGISPSSLRWNEAVLAVGISDVRNLKADDGGTLAGEKLTFLPGSSLWSVSNAGIHAVVTPKVLQGEQAFNFTLEVTGSKGISFLPLGEETHVSASAPWGSPSFAGSYLPDEEKIDSGSFTASWHVSSLGRSYPSAWKSEGESGTNFDANDYGSNNGLFMSTPPKPVAVYSTNGDPGSNAIASSAFGVNLFREVTFYTLVSRTVKYAILFIALTFLAFYLFEISARIKVHPFQYLLIGAALVLFYLLLLSFAELVGFGFAYLLATILTLGLVTWYSSTVLGTGGRATRIAAILAVLYAYLYAILQLEQYSLLFGTLFLFIALAVVMRATRSIEWYKEETQ